MEPSELARVIREWCEREDYAHLSDAMVVVAMDDPDYWERTSLWVLLDAAREGGR